MPLIVSDTQRWADLTLQRAGLPVTPENEQTLYKWARSEGGLNHNNPLNTTQNWPGASLWNQVGVKTYPNLDVGASATAQTLTNGFYPDILSMFQNSVPTSQWSQAARAQVSKWGTNTAFLGGGNVAPPAKNSPLSGASTGFLASTTTPKQSTGGNDPGNIWQDILRGLGPASFGLIPTGGSSSGGNQSSAPDPLGIGAAIGGATGKFLAGGEILLGAILMGAAALILMQIVVKASGVQARVGSVVGAAAPAPARVAARAASPAPKPAPAPSTRPITAGGREIKVTNPESRRRLAAEGVAA